MSKKKNTQINVIDAMTSPKSTKDKTTKPVRMQVTVDVAGKVAGKYALNVEADNDVNAANLANLLAEVGSQAAYNLYGKDIATKFGTYLFALPPPTAERLPYEPLYQLLTGILNETEDATGWSWEVRRLDNMVKLTKVDREGLVINTGDICASVTKAWSQCISANYNGAADFLRPLANVFAQYGIPYRTTEESAEVIGGPLPHIPHGAALAQRDLLRAATTLLPVEAQWRADMRCEALAAQALADPLTSGVDTAPNEAKSLVSELGLHPVRARHLAAALRASPDKVALLADALEASADNHRGSQEAINIVPPRPVWESYFDDEPKDVAITDARMAEIKADYLGDLAAWRESYGKVGPKRSNNLTRRAIAAMRFKWTGDDNIDDKAYERFEERFDGDSAEDVFRSAIRPWVGSKKFVEVGNTKFGVLPEKQGDWTPLRESDTPRDFYRLLYLTKPVGLDFNDLYGDSLFGIVSPCGRFAMSFYWHKYELAAYQFVVKELAVRTREERGAFSIQCGIPGVDNGVATMDKDAARWFKMVSMALGREWDVYGGNDFVV